jgi:lipoate-protein ligase A
MNSIGIYFHPMQGILRVIADGERDAGFNMAADVYLLRHAVETPEAVVLRLYGWNPPAISLGRMQDVRTNLDITRINADGLGWVRRPTGGRAILHWNDITYSCVFSKKMLSMGDSISRTYKVISACLISGLALAGIRCIPSSAGPSGAESRRDIKLPCFLSPNREEIMVDGRKLIGSAQKRTADAVLQHGSLPLGGEYRRLPEYLNLIEADKMAQKRLLEEKSLCVEECLSGASKELLVSHLAAGFEETLKLESHFSPWSPEEIAEIRAWLEGTNSNPG